MVLMVVVAFAVSWTPYFVVSLVTQWAQVNFLEEGHFFFTMLNLNLLAFLNSCVNPFIYATMSTRFRNGFLRCFRCFCFCFREREPIPSEQTDIRTKRVRFRCQPTCLNVQSSSDGCGSNVASDTSQRTAYTLDNTKRRGRANNEHKYIAHFIRKDGLVNFEKQPSGPSDNITVQSCYRVNSNSAVAKRKNSSSTGDMSVLNEDCVPKTEDSVCDVKRWSSCQSVNGGLRNGLAKDGLVNFEKQPSEMTVQSCYWVNSAVAKRKNSSSTGDMSVLNEDSVPKTVDSVCDVKRWSSCLSINGGLRNGLAF
ncbi:hypothetical protein JTE90_004416 [Oedothorax gibbosus]|uniref:G-protein coupled receptors family 1 profile domain-containing protein n=1 Tax=Oedothorax gibbosus TaxID=931172 RepID=A0AAV6UQ75_9ARAC|nr:hypothetical protein JTE90_004416 [Oedothorax gibbosus]